MTTWLVCGSRSIKDENFIYAALDEYIPAYDTIIHGGAIGVDRTAHVHATVKGMKVQVFAPDYDTYGKLAPIMRNKVMVDACDRVLAIWDGKSKGTKHTITYAKKQKKQVDVIEYP